jgi:hypothetical protein
MPYPPENYPLTPAGVDDYPAKVGSMLLTLVDPHKGFEEAYNRWYERDHYYAGCLEGPWQTAGSRWVATREMKDLRWGTDVIANPIDAGSFVAIYWVENGHTEEWDAWALPQVGQLYANGRGFAERSHVHTASFDRLGVAYRDSDWDAVPIDLALDHHYEGIVTVFLDGLGLDAQPLHDKLVESGAVAELLKGSDIEIASSWQPRPEYRKPRDSPMPLGSPGGGDNRLCQLFFVGGDVRESLAKFKAYTDRIDSEGIADVQLVAPFLRTNVGTSQYVNEIW